MEVTKDQIEINKKLTIRVLAKMYAVLKKLETSNKYLVSIKTKTNVIEEIDYITLNIRVNIFDCCIEFLANSMERLKFLPIESVDYKKGLKKHVKDYLRVEKICNKFNPDVYKTAEILKII